MSLYSNAKDQECLPTEKHVLHWTKEVEAVDDDHICKEIHELVDEVDNKNHDATNDEWV